MRREGGPTDDGQKRVKGGVLERSFKFILLLIYFFYFSFPTQLLHLLLMYSMKFLLLEVDDDDNIITRPQQSTDNLVQPLNVLLFSPWRLQWWSHRY